MLRHLSLILILLAGLTSCSKYEDEQGYCEQCQTRKYCNDPEAVNYNVGFPGVADNSVCYYPADAFAGSYRFADSVYAGGNTPVRIDNVQFTISANDRNKFSLNGLCASGAQLRFTANRALRAYGDSTNLKGQAFCRTADTISGYISRTLADSTRLKISLTVISDTGYTTHQGTAYRQ